MGLKHYTKLVPEFGEMCWEDDAIWYGLGGGAVLCAQGEAINHFRQTDAQTIVNELGEMIGWTIPPIEVPPGLEIDGGWWMVQVKRDPDKSWPGDMHIFPTPLGDAFLFVLERIPS